MLGLQDGWLWEPAEGGRAEGWGWDTKPATTCEQYLVSSRWTGKRLHIVTRYISLTLPCDFACVCVYLSVVVWAVVRTMRPKNLHAWSRSICMSDPHSTGLRSELEAGDVSSSLHTCRYLWPLLQYHLMDWTSVSLPDSPQGGFIWDLVFQLLGCLNCLHRGKCTCFIICGLYQDRFIISVRLYSCENSSQ